MRNDREAVPVVERVPRYRSILPFRNVPLQKSGTILSQAAANIKILGLEKWNG
jgi:hypothetical protein